VTMERSAKVVSTETPVIISSAGKVAVLGLEGIRTRLHDRWGALSEKVHAYFNAMLEREMKPGDCYHKLDELSYLVLFRDLSVAEAQLKCVAIAEAASRRLFGEDIGAVSVRVVVAAIDNALVLQSPDPIAVVQTTLQNIGTETVVEHKNRHVPEGNADVGQRPNHLDADPQLLKITFGSGFEHSETLALDKITFQYRPIWDSTRKVVLTYLCQPTPPLAASIHGEAVACGYWVARNSKEAFLLDLHVVREVVKRIETLRNEGFRIVAACPVHFDTIAHSRSWKEYLRVLDSAGNETVRDIAFLLIGIDEGVPNVRLVQEIPKVSLCSKLVFAAIDYHEGAVSRFERTGVHAIGIELRNMAGSEQQLLAAIDTLARQSENSGVVSFILGAKSKSVVVSAIASGVRYLEGQIIAAPVPEPRHAFVREIADLYR
jgi:hypothetical protein